MKKTPNRKKIRLPGKAYENGNAFFITISTFHRYPWFERFPDLADNLSRLFYGLSDERQTKFYAWCIMPDHVHLLMTDEDVVKAVGLMKGRLTPKARAIEPSRPLWQRSFYDHGLRREESLPDLAEYIWQNPVREGIVANPAEYQWAGSTVWPDWREWDLD